MLYRFRILLIVLMATACLLSYAYEFTYTKGNDSYTIQSDYTLQHISKYTCPDYKISDSVDSVTGDSVITFVCNRDTLCIFVADEFWVFYCLKIGDKYQLLDYQGIPYAFFVDYYVTDINKDNLPDVMCICWDDGTYYLTVRSYNAVRKKLTQIYDQNIYFFCSDTENEQYFYKLSHNQFYILYQYVTGTGKPIVKYGKLVYTRDRSREIYFKPISTISIKKWEKL